MNGLDHNGMMMRFPRWLLPQGVKACKLHGVAEVDETYELRSCKGQRVWGRLSRQRGGTLLEAGRCVPRACT